jgi:hypothetical protein
LRRGAAIVWGKKIRWAGFLLSAIGLLWTNAGKALALAGAGLLAARSLAALSGLFLSAFLILAGVQHFFYAQFVAGLVPAWIPGHLFWTYFAGVALIAGGLGMIAPRTKGLAGYLGRYDPHVVFLLHIPRAVAALHNANETTAVFEALAISGTGFWWRSRHAEKEVNRD